MWHVSSCSGVATLQTAIHMLLTYLLTEMIAESDVVDHGSGVHVITATPGRLIDMLDKMLSLEISGRSSRFPL